MSTAAAATLPAEEAPVRGNTKLIVIIAAAVVLVAAVSGGIAWYLHKKAVAARLATGDSGEAAKTDKKKKKDDVKAPVFTTLENFTVNLAGEGDHFLQLGVVLQLKDEETAEHVKSYLPQIRNKVLLIASAKNAEELQTAQGKQALIAEILEATRAPLKDDGEDVQAVLLGGMLIQ